MNNKIFTKVLSFVLVLCMIVPLFGWLDLDLGLEAHAAANDDTFELSDFTASSPSHPYLLANEDQFDKLNAIYSGTENDPAMKGYLTALVDDIEKTVFKQFSNDDTGTVLKAPSYALTGGMQSLSDMPYDNATGMGYDGVRQNEGSQHADRIVSLAYAYQVTRNPKYAKLALEYAVALCSWVHWGAGHFLNAADTASRMALAFDWCYNIWQTIDSAKWQKVRDGLFTKGVMAGVYDTYKDLKNSNGKLIVSTDYHMPWKSPGVGYSAYHTRDNNWNAVCSSGMALAALALMTENVDASSLQITGFYADGNSKGSKFTAGVFGNVYSYWKYGWYEYASIDTSKIGGTNMRNICAWLISDNLPNLKTYGLGMYNLNGAAAGDYHESATYWSYGTNALFKMMDALIDTTGHDFGLKSVPGIAGAATAYYSYHVQSSDGEIWGYHDNNGTGALDTSMNAIFGELIGDTNIVSYRKYLVEKGATSISLYDTLASNFATVGTEYENMPLDYYMAGVQGYTMRESWHADSSYVAFMGGRLNDTHTQLDSGAFVYYNNDTKWFLDLGTENYNVYRYGYGMIPDSFNYYPSSAEGNNTLITSALPYGQYVNLLQTSYKSGGFLGIGASTSYSFDMGTLQTKIDDYYSDASGGYAILDQSNAYRTQPTVSNKETTESTSYVVNSAYRGILMTNDRKTTVIQDEISFKSSQTSHWIGHLSDDIDITLSDDGRIAYLTDGESTIRCTIVSDNQSFTFSVYDCSYENGEFFIPFDDSSNYFTDIPCGTDATGNYSSGLGYAKQNDYSKYQKLVIACENVSTVKLAVVIEEIVPGDSEPTTYTWMDMSSWQNAVKADDKVVDGKVLLDKDFDATGIGSFDAEGGNYKLLNTEVNGADNAMGFYPASAITNPTSLTLACAPARVANSSIGSGMLVTELDIATLDTIPADLRLQLWGTDIYPLIDIPMKETFQNVGKDFVHITVIYDADSNTFFIFEGDDCVKHYENRKSLGFKDLSLKIVSDGGAAGDGTLLVDNVLIRRYTESYTELDSILGVDSSTGTVTGTPGNITSWDDKDLENSIAGIKPEYVAEIYNAVESAPGADIDTPVVDLWGDGTATEEVKPQAGVTTNSRKQVSSFPELVKLINESADGTYTNIVLNTHSAAILNIEKPIVIDTKGYDFTATSSALICEENGNILTYKAGEVTVSFIVDGKTYSKTYTSAAKASYELSAAETGAITEVAAVDEKGNTIYKYYTRHKNSWSLEMDGEPAYGSDAIVTSKNNVFYAAKRQLYDGLYVTVRDGIVTAGGTAQELFSKAFSSSVNADRVSLTSDIYYDAGAAGSGSSFKSGLSKLYLNGYTLGFRSTMEGGHMFQINQAQSFEIYGPGKLDNDAPIGCTFISFLPGGNMSHNGTRNYVKVLGADLDISYSVCDIRCGDFIVEDCNITSDTTKSQAVFNGSVWSSPNNNATSDPVLLPHIYINNTDVDARNLTGENCVILISDNCSITFADGANFDAPNSPALINIRNLAGVATKQINLGEFTHNCKALYLTSGDTIDTSFIENSILKQGEGKGFTKADGDALPQSAIANGYVLAYTGSEGYYYKIVKESDAAKITWSHNGASVTQYWIAGVTPRILDAAKSQLTGTPSANHKFTYNMTELLANGGKLEAKAYTFSSVELPNITIKMAMTLQSEFIVNFYFEMNESVFTYDSFNVNGTDIALDDAEIVEIDGKQFYFVKSPISPKNAAENITVFARITEGGAAKTILASTSIANYANTLIKTSSDEKTKQLMVSIIDYISAVANYEGDSFAMESLNTISSSFTGNRYSASLASNNVDTSAIGVGISSAYLSLAKHPRFVFGLKSGFTGTITFSYVSSNDKDGTVTHTIEVTDGKYNGSNVFMIDMRAYDIDKDITISVDGGSSVVYNLNAYYTAAVQDADALYDLLVALKVYCATANMYITQ